MLQKCSCPSPCAVCDLGDAECAGFGCVRHGPCAELPGLLPLSHVSCTAPFPWPRYLQAQSHPDLGWILHYLAAVG